jgi:cobalt-zinc-cadmium resistance protein CzcA
VQKPLALVVVGGSLVAPFLILLVLPVLIEIFARDGRAKPRPEPATMVPPVAEA